MDHEVLYDIIYALLGIGLYLAQTTWRVVRERNYCREVLAREQQSHMRKQSELLKSSIERQNEMLRVLATAFASAEPVTLDDLLMRAEHDWSVRSSKTPPER